MGTSLNNSLGFELTSSVSSGNANNEQDANAALLELDKILRSTKVGDQCEGIVRYTRLFERFPFPILINAAFLRLADVFISGNNFLRLCILKVVQQSQRDLDKIISVDEFLRRIFQVIHSNDPVARGVTLRLLGEMARIMPERTSVHHAIRCALDSHDKVELEAAIVAAASFAKESKTFASSIFSKLTSMIDGLATPAEMKLKLIRIFQSMHHDNQLSLSVRAFLTGSSSSRPNFLAANPSQSFVVTVLDTLTRLATRSVVDIPDQVRLLIHHLQTDPRVAVKRCALGGLKTLADENPHRWDEDSLSQLLAFVGKLIEDTMDDVGTSHASSQARLMTSTLYVLTSLSKSVSLDSFPVFDPDSPALRTVFLNLCFHEDLRVAAAACQLFSDLALVSDGKNDNAKEKDAARTVLTSDAASALETFLIIGVQTSSHSTTAFPWTSIKRGMRSVIQLCRASPSIAVSFVATISALLKIADEETTILLLETLAAIGSYNVAALRTISEDLEAALRKTRKSISASSRFSSIDHRRLELLCTLIFQAATSRNVVDSSPDAKDFKPVLETIVLSPKLNDNWSAYRISRQAARYGHHDVAVGILRRLSSCGVASTFFSAWLKGFHHLCRVEDILRQLASTGIKDAMGDAENAASVPSPLPSLLAATEAAHLGVTQLTAASSPVYPLTFPLQLARLRAASLQSCIQLLRASICLRTCPPPAIASSTLTGSGTDAATKGSRVSSQLHGVSKEFRALADQVNGLLQASFDADALSLKYLNLLRLSASILIAAIDSLIIYAPSGQKTASSRGLASTQVLNSLIGGADAFSLLDVKSTPLDLRRMAENCKSAMDKLSSIVEHPTRPLPTVDKRVQLIQELCLTLIAQPLPFPRYFFQSLQVTNIKLAISPQPKVQGEPVTVVPDTQLVLKVEGVIQRGASTSGNAASDTGGGLASVNVTAAPPLNLSSRHNRKRKFASSKTNRPSSSTTDEKRHRNIRKVVVTVKTSLQSKAASAMDVNLKPEVTTLSLSRSVIPQNDYFCQQFLLPFHIAGIHLVAIQVSVQDQVGSEWMTGPRASITVKVLEAADPSARRSQEPLIGNSTVNF